MTSPQVLNEFQEESFLRSNRRSLISTTQLQSLHQRSQCADQQQRRSDTLLLCPVGIMQHGRLLGLQRRCCQLVRLRQPGMSLSPHGVRRVCRHVDFRCDCCGITLVLDHLFGREEYGDCGQDFGTAGDSARPCQDCRGDRGRVRICEGRPDGCLRDG